MTYNCSTSSCTIQLVSDHNVEKSFISEFSHHITNKLVMGTTQTYLTAIRWFQTTIQNQMNNSETGNSENKIKMSKILHSFQTPYPTHLRTTRPAKSPAVSRNAGETRTLTPSPVQDHVTYPEDHRANTCSLRKIIFQMDNM